MTEQETVHRIHSREYSSGAAAYHFLQPDVRREELSDGSLVARLGTALIGDPVSVTGSLDSFARALATDAPETSVFHIEHKTARALQRHGYRVFPLGVESRIPLPFSLRGRDKADLRRALNRSRTANVQVIELNESEYDRFSTQITELNQRWLANRRHFTREFRFLARPFVDRYQPGERRFIALRNNRPVGVAAYDPVYRSGKCVGYFEAIMRCDEATAPGARDLLTITALEAFACESPEIQWVSLGLSPFAPVSDFSEFYMTHSFTHVALDLFYRHGSHVFDCQGLAFHKERYRGIAVPIYFATKSRFPLLTLYHACRKSNIDPLQPIRNKLTALRSRGILTLKQIHSGMNLLKHRSVGLLHYGHK